jgi:hypothetical protein
MFSGWHIGTGRSGGGSGASGLSSLHIHHLMVDPRRSTQIPAGAEASVPLLAPKGPRAPPVLRPLGKALSGGIYATAQGRFGPGPVQSLGTVCSVNIPGGPIFGQVSRIIRRAHPPDRSTWFLTHVFFQIRTAAVVMAEAVLGSCRATPRRKIRADFFDFFRSLQAIMHCTNGQDGQDRGLFCTLGQTCIRFARHCRPRGAR